MSILPTSWLASSIWSGTMRRTRSRPAVASITADPTTNTPRSGVGSAASCISVIFFASTLGLTNCLYHCGPGVEKLKPLGTSLSQRNTKTRHDRAVVEVWEDRHQFQGTG